MEEHRQILEKFKKRLLKKKGQTKKNRILQKRLINLKK